MPFQEPRSRDGQAAALSRPEELGSPAVEKFLRDLNSHGVNLGSKCLESFSNISDTAQSVLLRSLMARLREGLEDQAWLSFPLHCNSPAFHRMRRAYV